MTVQCLLFIPVVWKEENYNEKAADVNGDNKINLKDVVLIHRYIAGGWNVILQ